MIREPRRREAGFGEGQRSVAAMAGLIPALVLIAIAMPTLEVAPRSIGAIGATLSFALCIGCSAPGYYTSAPEIGFGAAVVAWIAAVIAYLVCGYVEATQVTTALASLGAGAGVPAVLLSVWWVLELRDRHSRPT